MLVQVLPFITKGLTLTMEYALAIILKLLFLLLILLCVTTLTSITILMIHILFAFEIMYVEACICGPAIGAIILSMNHFGCIATLILVFSVRYDTTTQFFKFFTFDDSRHKQSLLSSTPLSRHLIPQSSPIKRFNIFERTLCLCFVALALIL